ncbi:MAG: hypothetical protein IT332_02655 [Ardenticatenales bacterium]|nr:hypothetical protein [Ardenticatenales bacterium]
MHQRPPLALAARAPMALAVAGLVAVTAVAVSAFPPAAQAVAPRAASLRAPDDAPAQATPEPGMIIVRGAIYYSDRASDMNHPAAGVKVEVYDKDEGFPVTSQLLATTYTDEEGRYASKEVPNVDQDGASREGTQDIFLKVYTEGKQVRLLQAGTPHSYVWTSYELNERSGNRKNVPDGIVGFPSQYIAEKDREIEAMWTFVDLASEWFFLRDAAGRDPGTVTAYWSAASQDGPRFDRAGKTLYFRDEDARSGDLVLRYGAYALLDSLLGDQAPAGWQGCFDIAPPDIRLKSDPACALLHGLAAFIPIGVKADPRFSTPALRTMDLDAATTGTPDWEDGDTVPGRIAGAFWDLFEKDATMDGTDVGNATFKEVFAVVDAKHPATLKDWWEGWKEMGGDGCLAIGALYQNTINYNTPPVIQPIPDVVLEEDQTAIVDLKNYVSDADCGDDALRFTMLDAGDPLAGVKLLPTNVISITPAAQWFGTTTVRIEVSDGLVKAQLSFRVIVNSINDCPKITPRIPDPAPALWGQIIELSLLGNAQDTEDPQDKLSWDVEIPPDKAKDVTVTGRGGQRLAFLLNGGIKESYSLIVTLVVTDRDGCSARQAIALYWSNDRNTPPFVEYDKLRREYVAPVNTTITVDLTGMATDKEDPPQNLEWFVLNPDGLHAQVNKTGRQVIDFEPDVGFVGSDNADLEVQDSGGARATAGITLTWRSRNEDGNIPPRILRDKLRGMTVARNQQACYDLTYKADDPDHNVLSLRWFAEPYDSDSLFVAAQGTRELCFRSRTNFVGCLEAKVTVKDPRDGQDTADLRTCWRKADLFLPFTAVSRR